MENKSKMTEDQKENLKLSFKKATLEDIDKFLELEHTVNDKTFHNISNK